MHNVSPDAALMACGASFRIVRPMDAERAGLAQPAPPAAAAKASRPPQILKLLDPTQWTEPAPPRAWIVTDWVPRRRVTLLQGNGGDGKSLVAQQLLTCAAAGLSWLGLDTAPGRALGIMCEDEPDELQRRQQAINAALGIGPADLANLRLLSRLGEDSTLINFGTCDSGELTPFFDDLDATLRDFKPALLVIDTAADTFGGNENIRPQVRRFIGTCLGRLAIEHDCGVVLLAHPSQAGLRDGSGTSGSTAWGNTVRSRIYMTRPSEEEGGALSDRRILTRMKANYAACGARVDIVWRNGAFVLAEAAEAFDAATWPVIHAMFDELEKAWSEGRAWSYRAETRTGGRYFPSWARKQLGVPEDRTKHLLSEWLESGCLTFEMFDARAKTKGLRVIRRPDQ